MLRLNKKVEYAIIALIELENSGDDQMLTVKEIVSRSEIPGALAGKILQTLNKSGIVQSVQGINGGYKLALPFSEIRLKELIEAVTGPISLVECLIDPSKCGSQADCGLLSPMERIQAGIINYLVNITMADIKQMYAQSNDPARVEEIGNPA